MRELSKFIKLNSQITFQKQSIQFEADPNTAKPHVEVSDNNLILSFAAKDSDSYVKVNFIESLMYRTGSPNDEGFYSFSSNTRIKNNSIYSHKNFPDLNFGYFYQVFGLDWKNNLLGEGTKILDEKYKEREGFLHYVFFMKDGTFECIAKGWKVK